MKVRILAVGLICLSLITLITGCGGGSDSGSSFSSSWLGITTDPNSTGSWKVDVMPSAVSLRPGQIISVAVLVKDIYGHPLDAVSVQFASLLPGGTFEDQNGETVKGWFSTRFTAGTTQGTDAITVLTRGAMGSKSLLIQPAIAKSITVKLVTSAATTLAENSITVATGVSADGAPAEESEVFLSSTLPGKFGSESGKVTGGWFSTSFTPDADATGIGTITAMVNNISASTLLSVVKQKKETPQLSISVNPDSVFQGQTAAVIVISKDSSGFPSNAEVYLDASLDGLFDGKKTISGTPVDGIFFTEFTAANEIGSATLSVSCLGASASTILSIERPNIVMKISPSVNSVKIGEKVPVSILVTNEFSSPIAKAPVHLLAELGCYCDPENGETNDNGFLFFDFVASRTSGISTIHALTEGATASAQITVVGP